jgi:hypothetical protein
MKLYNFLLDYVWNEKMAGQLFHQCTLQNTVKQRLDPKHNIKHNYFFIFITRLGQNAFHI